MLLGLMTTPAVKLFDFSAPRFGLPEVKPLTPCLSGCVCLNTPPLELMFATTPGSARHCCAIVPVLESVTPCAPGVFGSVSAHGSTSPVGKVCDGPVNSSPMFGARTAFAYVARKRMSGIGAQSPPMFHVLTEPTVE